MVDPLLGNMNMLFSRFLDNKIQEQTTLRCPLGAPTWWHPQQRFPYHFHTRGEFMHLLGIDCLIHP